MLKGPGPFTLSLISDNSCFFQGRCTSADVVVSEKAVRKPPKGSLTEMEHLQESRTERRNSRLGAARNREVGSGKIMWKEVAQGREACELEPPRSLG